MQETTPPSEQHELKSSEDLHHATVEPPGHPGDEVTTHAEQNPLRVEDPLEAGPPAQPHRDRQTDSRRSSLPQRGRSSALIAGTIAGISNTLLTIVVILITAGVFRAASQQIAVDRLTVKTALALAGLELLLLLIGLLISFSTGFILGRIVVLRRLGFLAGALAGALFSLLTFFVGLIPGYPGTLVVTHGAPTPADLVLSLLQLCLWSIGGGLVSLFGTWIATLSASYYRKNGEEIH